MQRFKKPLCYPSGRILRLMFVIPQALYFRALCRHFGASVPQFSTLSPFNQISLCRDYVHRMEAEIREICYGADISFLFLAHTFSSVRYDPARP